MARRLAAASLLAWAEAGHAEASSEIRAPRLGGVMSVMHSTIASCLHIRHRPAGRLLSHNAACWPSLRLMTSACLIPVRVGHRQHFWATPLIWTWGSHQTRLSVVLTTVSN